MQSTPAAPGKWAPFASEGWKSVYGGRVQAVVETLRAQRCRQLIWVLQPGFEKNPYLARNRQLINDLQLSGTAGGALVVEVEAGAGDYGVDGTTLHRTVHVEARRRRLQCDCLLGTKRAGQLLRVPLQNQDGSASSGNGVAAAPCPPGE